MIRAPCSHLCTPGGPAHSYWEPPLTSRENRGSWGVQFEEAHGLEITAMKYQQDFISRSFVFFFSEHNPEKWLGKAKSENVNTLVNQPTFNENSTHGGLKPLTDHCSTSLAPEGEPPQWMNVSPREKSHVSIPENYNYSCDKHFLDVSYPPQLQSTLSSTRTGPGILTFSSSPL